MAQVHDDFSLFGKPAQGTVNASTALVEPNPSDAFAQRTGGCSQFHAQGQATEEHELVRSLRALDSTGVIFVGTFLLDNH